MDLKTHYLGLELKNPLISGASPLADDLDKVKALEDAGASAITMYSLFEEQITHNAAGAESHIEAYQESFSEAVSYFSEVDLLDFGPDTYIEQLQKVREAVDIPVIGSLNGTREGDWVEYARLIESAGADALELNLYFLASDPNESGAALEERCLRIVRAVREQVRIPLAVKLSPFFTALPNFAVALADAGADGIVLFNRFYQPDIDIEELEFRASLKLSFSNELLSRLRWLAILEDRVDADLSVSGGVHSGVDAIKAIMSGAHSVQLVSALLINGPQYLGTVLKEMRMWMQEKEYTSVQQLRGCMGYSKAPNPEALERANYMRILKSWDVRDSFY